MQFYYDDEMDLRKEADNGDTTFNSTFLHLNKITVINDFCIFVILCFCCIFHICLFGGIFYEFLGVLSTE